MSYIYLFFLKVFNYIKLCKNIYWDAGEIFHSKLLHEESQQNQNWRKFKIQVLLHFVLFIPKIVWSIFFFIFFPLADAAKFPQETKEIMEEKCDYLKEKTTKKKIMKILIAHWIFSIPGFSIN